MIAEQIFWIVLLSIVVVCISWTVTQEEIFREWRDKCEHRSKVCRTILQRKFFYVFTCEYCFSHWVTIGVLIVTEFKLLFDDWRGYVISFFVIVWLANVLMSFYRRIRVEIKHEHALAKAKEKEIEE